MSGIVELVVVLGLACAAGWACWRIWRVRTLGARLVGGIVTGLLTLLLAAIGVVGLVGVYRLDAPHGGPAPSVQAAATADQLALATRRLNGCAGCHSSTGGLPLDGGTDNFLGGGGPGLGVLVAPNLTPGGPLKDWSDGEILRAVREGVDRDGHPLLIMPADAFHHLSDADGQVLVASLRAQPAASRTTPGRDLNLLGLLLVGAGLFPTAEQPHIAQPQPAPPAGPTPAYGQYLVDVTGCSLCHGPNLEGRSGGGGFGPPAGPNLRALVPTWQQADFVRFFRSGQDPYGRAVDPALMPWTDIGKMYSDEELAAIYAAIRGST